MLEHERGHSWRTTNTTLLFDVLPGATRMRLFGHAAAVDRKRYTALTSTEAVVSAAIQGLREVTAKVTAASGIWRSRA